MQRCTHPLQKDASAHNQQAHVTVWSAKNIYAREKPRQKTIGTCLPVDWSVQSGRFYRSPAVRLGFAVQISRLDGKNKKFRMVGYASHKLYTIHPWRTARRLPVALCLVSFTCSNLACYACEQRQTDEREANRATHVTTKSQHDFERCIALNRVRCFDPA